MSALRKESMRLLRYICVCSALLLFTVPSYAMTFSSRAVFDAAAPGLPIETFETGLVATAGIVACNGPVSSASGSTCFPVSALLPGAIYSASPGSSLVLIGAGLAAAGNASKVLGPNLFTDTFNINFTNAAIAIGFDVYPGPSAGDVQVTVFDPNENVIGAYTFAAAVGPSFFGVTFNSDLIGRVNVASQATPAGELIDNVAFGIPSATVPEPSSLALMAGGLAVLLRFRRKLS
jgi:hypothetical protein